MDKINMAEERIDIVGKDLLEQLIKNMKNKFKKYLKNYMIKEIYIKENMRDYTVPLANHSLQKHN